MPFVRQIVRDAGPRSPVRVDRLGHRHQRAVPAGPALKTPATERRLAIRVRETTQCSSRRTHLSRRTVLRGLGATVALPFLESMVAAQTPLAEDGGGAETAVRGDRDGARRGRQHASRRQGCNYWSPAKDGRDFEFTSSLRSLEPYRDYITIVSNTDLNGAAPWSPKEEGADHTRSSAVLLTAAHPKMTEGSDFECGPSIDQIYAQALGQDTPIPSIQLCIEDVGSLSAACGYGYSCVYTDAISWATPRRRCRRSASRASSSSGCSAPAARPRSDRARRAEDRSMLDRVPQRGRPPAAGPRARRPAPARRLPGERARDRAANPEDRGPQRVARQPNASCPMLPSACRTRSASTSI